MPWLVLGLGLIVAGIGWNLSRESQLRRVETDFRLRADRATAEIRNRLHAYEQVLRGGVALFDATGTISRAQWRVYVDRLKIGESFPGVQGIGFVKMIADQGKAAHIRTMRSEGLTDYEIRPDGVRNVYMPIIYLEPFGSRIPSAFGYDMSAEPIRRAAMERARDEGKAIISGKVKLIHETDEPGQTGFLMYVPIYRGGIQPESVDNRRTQLAGYVYAPFRVNNLMGGALDAQKEGIDLEIFDGLFPGSESLLFDLDKIPRFLDHTARTSLSLISTLDLNGRSWTLRYEALPAFFAGRGDNQPFLVLAGGTIISLLLFGLTWFAVRTRNSALTLAKQMSLASHENERRFTGIFYSAMDAIISVDESQNIVHFNPAAERIFRCDAVQVAGTPLSRFIPQRFRESHVQHVERFGLTGISDRQMGNKSDLFGLRFNGEEFPLEASISQTTQNGRKLFTVMLRDVSARRQAEVSLRNSEQRFRGLVEVSPEAILIHQDGKIIFSNKAAIALFGAAESDHLTGTSIFRFFHPDSLDSVRQTIESIMAGAPSMPIMERKVVRLSGELRYVEVAVSVFEEAGKHIILEMMRDITDRHLDRAALEHSHAELRQLGVALEIAQEGERKRIAQELHDDLGQTLTVLKMDMSSLKSQLMATPADATACATWLDDIDRMDGLLNHTVLSVRQISAGLRPQLLDDLGLATALEALVMQVSRSSHIHCTIELNPERLLIDQRLATPLYRIAQEALNNVVKHAKATEVSLRLYRDVASYLILEVRDNGIGITGEDRRKAASFGLIGMRERVYALNGELLIESQGNGTLIHVAIPSNENGSFSKA